MDERSAIKTLEKITADATIARELHIEISTKVDAVVYASEETFKEHGSRYWEYYMTLAEQKIKERGYRT